MNIVFVSKYLCVIDLTKICLFEIIFIVWVLLYFSEYKSQQTHSSKVMKRTYVPII